MENERDYIVIYKAKLAAFLTLRGFVCFNMADDLKDKESRRKVFYFRYSTELQKTISIYANNKIVINRFIQNLT